MLYDLMLARVGMRLLLNNRPKGRTCCQILVSVLNSASQGFIDVEMPGRVLRAFLTVMASCLGALLVEVITPSSIVPRISESQCAG
jgi:hypothetical protein